MSATIVPQLIKKDLRILRPVALAWWVGGLVALVMMLFLDLFLFGMILFVTCLAGAGMHAAVQTVIEERREKSLSFILGLPVSLKDYTLAKLGANLILFGALWGSLSAASLLMFLDPEGMQRGALPFVIIVLVGIFLAVVMVLVTSLLTGSNGATVGAIVGSNLVTQLFLWWVADLEGIRSVIGGEVAVWNGTTLIVLAGQVLAIGALLGVTYVLQGRKTTYL